MERQRRLWIWPQRHLFQGEEGSKGQMVPMMFEPDFLKPVMPHLWSRHQSCQLWKQGINSHIWFPGDGERDRSGDAFAYASKRRDEISAEYESDLLCSCKAFSPPFISLFWAVRAHPTSLFWCCFVAMVTMCYCMRHGAVCTVKTILSLQPGYQLRSFHTK